MENVLHACIAGGRSAWLMIDAIEASRQWRTLLGLWHQTSDVIVVLDLTGQQPPSTVGAVNFPQTVMSRAAASPSPCLNFGLSEKCWKSTCGKNLV